MIKNCHKNLDVMKKKLKISIIISLLFFCLLLSSASSDAKVQIQSTYYNSEAKVTENLQTTNADYSGVTVLTPSIIVSVGSGKSVEDEFNEFSHFIFAENGGDSEYIEASLKMDYGKYEWKKGVKASSDGLVLGMSVGCEVEGDLEASYSNSRVSHTEELTIENAHARYSENTLVDPNVIISSGTGSGSSMSTNSMFSHESKVEKDGNCENTDAYLRMESGEYKWKKGVKVIPEGLTMSMLVGCKVEGNLEASYSNPRASHTEDLTIENAHYSEYTLVNLNTIRSSGTGSSMSPSSKFLHKSRVENGGKHVEIEANLTCNYVDYGWKKILVANSSNNPNNPNDASMTMMVKGESETTEGYIETEMDGNGSDFPHQHLPPGRLLHSTELFVSAINATGENYSSYPIPPPMPTHAPHEMTIEDMESIMDKIMGTGEEEHSPETPELNSSASDSNPSQNKDREEDPEEEQDDCLIEEGEFDFFMGMRFKITDIQP